MIEVIRVEYMFYGGKSNNVFNWIIRKASE